MEWKELLNKQEKNVKVIIIGNDEDLEERFYKEIVAICPADRKVMFQVKWIQKDKLIEVIFYEENVTWIKQHFPLNAYSKERGFLRIDSFWQRNKDMVDYQRETILLVRENEFYKDL